MKLSVDSLCTNLYYYQVDKVLNKKCQKYLSVGIQMPYLCIITLPHHSASLFRPLTASREITVKPRWFLGKIHPDDLHSLLPFTIFYRLFCTCNLNHFYWYFISYHFLLRKAVISPSPKKTIKTSHMVGNQGKLALWGMLPNLYSIIILTWLATLIHHFFS